MLDVSKLQDGSILICPSTIKDNLIKIKSCNNVNIDIKFLSKEDLIKGFYFSYDINALYYLHNVYHYDYHLAEEILNNLHNISPINDKLVFLNNLYNELENNNLLKINPYFKQLFINKKVYLFGYSKYDQELIDLIKKLNCNYEYLNNETTYQKDLFVSCFKDMESEVSYVISKIGSLLTSGVSLNKIFFYKTPKEYKLILKKALFSHNIKMNNEFDIFIYDTPLFKKYLSLLENHSLNDAYKILTETNSYDPFDVLGTLVNIIVEVVSLKIDKEEQIKLLNYLSSITKVQQPEYKESIKEINDDYNLQNDEYCFMLGFSLGTYPIIIKDTDFYLDSEKILLKRNTSLIMNLISEEKLVNFIKRSKNLYISFKEKIDKTVYYPSLLIDKLKMKKLPCVIDNIRYSKKYAELEVSKYYDLNSLYGVENKWMATFTKDDLEYNIYNHKYKGINIINNQELTLSYTQIDDYIKCPFKYYLKHILNIDEFIGNFKTEIGTLFHNILEEATNKEIAIEDYYDEILKKFETYKDRYFANKILPKVLNVISKNNDFHSLTMLNNISYEKEIKIKLDERSYLMGRIDKFLVDDIAKAIAVVDYKTGKFSFDKKKVELGLNLQLPIYALLLTIEFPEYLIAGVYIQKVLLEKDDIEENDAYLLDGITLNDLNIIRLIDPSLGMNSFDDDKNNGKSIYIKGIKLKENGQLYSNCPVVYRDELSYLLELTKKHIKTTLEGIRMAKFDISPLDVKEENGNACTYCKFSDICNFDYKDIRYVSLKERKE